MGSFYRIGKAKIAITSTSDTCDRIKEYIKKGCKGYVCISNMRTVVLANTDKAYTDVMDNSLFNTPDGTPLLWCARFWGIREAQRACGPHVFRALLKDKDPSLRHFFLGDTNETLAKLKKKCCDEYGANIVGSYSPPFCPIEEYDLKGIADMINESGATIVWTSLRAPKQDFLDSMLLPYLGDGVLLVGVGAAFRFELGEYRQPDGLLQKIGLAGLGAYRGTGIWKEVKWYVKHSFYLLGYLLAIIYKRLSRKKCYEW